MDLDRLAEHFDHFDPELARHRDEAYRYLRQHCPVPASDRHGGFFAATRYEDIRDIMSDPETFSSRALTIPHHESEYPFPLAQSDPPEHTAWRAVVQPWFSAKRLAVFEPTIREHTNELIDDFIEDGECDIAHALGYKLPADVIADIMGVPREEGEFFRDCAVRINSTNAEDPDSARSAFGELFEYYGKLLEQRRTDPQDDIPTILVNATVDGRPLTHVELVMFCIIIQAAGFDTTAGFMGCMLWHLAEHPDHRHRLLQDPSLIVGAVEEYLRAFPSGTPGREVRKPTTLRGRELQPGDRVLLLVQSANRDEEVFEHPDEIDFDRESNRHIAFGTGIHRCLGMHLARMEARILLEELLPRIPDFELAPGSEPEFSVGQNVGIHSLPVVFTPGERREPAPA